MPAEPLPKLAPWSIWGGNDEPRTFVLNDASGRLNLTPYTVRLRIIWPASTRTGSAGGQLNLGVGTGLTLGNQAVTEERGMVFATLSPTQTRLIPPTPPLGAVTTTQGPRYELELSHATLGERTWAYGPVTKTGGDNADG